MLKPIRILLACLLLPSTVSAMDLPWVESVPILVQAGPENPVIWFGFNPQPEPPPVFFRNDIFDPEAATRQISGVQPTPFLLFLAVRGGGFSYPPEPVIDFDLMSIGVTTEGGQDLTLQFRFTPAGDGDLSTGISDPLFFNPQPESPAQADEAMAFQFAFETFDESEAVGITMQAFNEIGETLSIAAVPLPPALLLMPMALLALGFRRRS